MQNNRNDNNVVIYCMIYVSCIVVHYNVIELFLRTLIINIDCFPFLTGSTREESCLSEEKLVKIFFLHKHPHFYWTGKTLHQYFDLSSW